MKIGFIIERIGMYRIYATVIEEALLRGHEVVCLHNYGQPRNGMKGYEFPYANKVPSFRSGTPCIIPYRNGDDFINSVIGIEIDVIVSGYFHKQYVAVREKLKSEGIRWVSIQHSLDTVVFAEFMVLPDLNLMYSEKWLDWAVQYLKETGKLNGKSAEACKSELEQRVRFTGYTEPDQKDMVNPEAIRQEWGIPEGKPVVLVIPIDIRHTDNRFYADYVYSMNSPKIQGLIARIAGKSQYLEHIEKGWNEANVVKAIRKFCDNNDAYLLVKARRKSPPSKHLRKVADKIMYDESYYPADIHKCLAIADVCINFFSTVSTIAVPSGVPNICIMPESEDIICSSALKPLAGMYNELFCHCGASYLLSIPEAINSLPYKSIKDFPITPEGRESYIEKFVGYADGKTATRMMDEIENLVTTLRSQVIKDGKHATLVLD